MLGVVYLAAAYGRMMELREVRAQLRAAGYEVSSRWLDGDPTDKPLTDEQYGREAMVDLVDLMAADTVISFTEQRSSILYRGGRHVEFGAAVAWQKRLIVVGDREHIFHYLPEVKVFPTWADALAQLREEARGGVSVSLPPICWVHRPRELSPEIEEAEDLCPDCCKKRVAAYQQQYPEHANEIVADGGRESCRESEDLATCEECGAALGCFLLPTFYDLTGWSDEDRTLDTMEKRQRAYARLAEQEVAVRAGEVGGSDMPHTGVCCE